MHNADEAAQEISSNNASKAYEHSLRHDLPWRVTDSKEDWMIIIPVARYERRGRRHTSNLRKWYYGAQNCLTQLAFRKVKYHYISSVQKEA